MEQTAREQLLGRIEHALRQFWLYKNVGRYWPLGTDPGLILQPVVRTAEELLAKIDEYDDELAGMVVDLYDLPQYDLAEAERILRDVRLKLAPSAGDLTSQEQMDALESLVSPLVAEVRTSPDFETASGALRTLDRIVGQMVSMFASQRADISNMVDSISQYFEHGYEVEVLREIYAAIRAGEPPWNKI